MSTPPFDVPTAERWFAVDLNNRTWDLVEAKTRTAEETESMLHAAHAALWHWSQVGQHINQLRALVLLATAYGKATFSTEAIRYAEQALALCDQLGDEPTAFDRASVHGSAATAYRLTGEAAMAEQHAINMQQAMESIDEKPDRDVLEQLYGPMK